MKITAALRYLRGLGLLVLCQQARLVLLVVPRNLVTRDARLIRENDALNLRELRARIHRLGLDLLGRDAGCERGQRVEDCGSRAQMAQRT